MSGHKRILFLILILTTVSLTVGAVSTALLYRVAIREEKERLTETAQSQARLMEAVARFDAVYSRDYPGGAAAATLSQVRDAHAHYEGFGETGEFVLAKAEGDFIVFLLRHRNRGGSEVPASIRLDAERAAPMRRSLSGRSGTMVGLDYQGTEVLAAYEPVGELGLGIVAKIDLTEIRAPFVKAAGSAALIGALTIAIGAALFVRTTNPLLRQLAESEERFRNTFEQAAVGIGHVRPDGRFIILNRRFSEIVGYTPEELLTRTLRDITHLDDVVAGDENVRRLLDGEVSTYSTETRLLRSSGSPAWINLTMSLTREPSGAPRYLIAVIEEITERKQMEQALQKSRSELEARVRERTAALTHINRELNEFAHIVSHDLKAPLRSISSLASWISEDCSDSLDGEGRENLALLMSRVQRMDHLIEGILRYSRIGRLDVEFEAIDSADLVGEVIGALACPDGISVSIEGALPTLRCNRTALEQIFQNLIGNALVHMGKPQGKVAVTCRDQGASWEFCVRDDGKGIEERHYERIFAMFQTLSSLEEERSMGIGLAIVKKNVESCGGRIWVESTPGLGSSFFFAIPKRSVHHTLEAI